MNRITIIFSIVTACITLALPARAETSNTFKNLTAYASSDGFSVVFEFDGKPAEKLRFSEKYIQINFSNSRMLTPKKLYEINRAGISTIEVSQPGPETVRVRIKPTGGMKALSRSLSLEKRDGRLVLKFAASEAAGAPVKKDKKKSIDKPLKHAAAKEKPAAREEKVESAAAAGAAAAADLTAALREATSPGMAGKDFEKELFLDYSEPTVPPLPSFGESIFKVGGALGIVLAMVLFLAFTAKRYLAGAETAMGTKKQVKVLSSHFIGVKKSVTLVEIAGEILVLGVTNDNINLLARYDDPEKIERIKFTQRLPDRPMGIFKRLPILSRMTGSRGRKKTAFAKEMDSRTRAMKERDEKTAVERKTAKEELVKKAAGTIASRMRAFEHAPA